MHTSGVNPKALSTRITAALLFLFLLAGISVGYTLYELNLRKHDYVILNLSGQLRALAQNMVNQSLVFSMAPMSMAKAPAEQQRFIDSLEKPMAQYARIIKSYQARELDPELTGRNAPLRCSWDAQSIAQLERSSKYWHAFKQRFDAHRGQGGDAARLAAYLIIEGPQLESSAKALSNSFQLMMERKMYRIGLFNQVMLVVMFVVFAALLWLLYRDFIIPLREAQKGFNRVAQGDFAARVPVRGDNELGHMAVDFNQLAGRLHAMFRLTAQIDRAKSLDETLRFVFDEFRHLLPLDWVGLLSLNGEQRAFVLDRRSGAIAAMPDEGEQYQAEGSLLEQALAQREPLHIADLGALVQERPTAEFAARLQQCGLQSALFYPLTSERKWGAILAFASTRSAAYKQEHLELLRNIAAQVAAGFEKNVVSEQLIISALTGLAKLAESRDAETGDHLNRMALYSAFIATELGKTGRYAGQIDNSWIRRILRFAPMHDIGKVGIEDSILLKPERLDAQERARMQEHPVIGGEVLRHCEAQMHALGYEVFQMGIEIAEGHHEKFDGSGYPRGQRGEAIPLSARIVAAADVFDALTSKRPYKDAWTPETALSEMHTQVDRHFDPDVIAAMDRAMPQIMEVYERLKHV